MEKISEYVTIEYKYDSKEEREKHVKDMESQGYDCSGQVRKTDGSTWTGNAETYWYAKFGKYN